MIRESGHNVERTDDAAPDGVIVLSGPTAVGKTELSLELARRLDGEVLSVDSRQIYRRMDIGTAKPTPIDRARVQHHFVDERDVDEPMSAGRFAIEAWRRIEDVHSRGAAVVAAGGSTLYLKALTEGMAATPPVPEEIRMDLNGRLLREGPAPLFRELMAVDPESAATMDATKSQRIIRALEVYLATGRPLSSYHKDRLTPPHAFRVFVLNRDRPSLYRRIEQRVDTMIESGLVDEVAGILDAGYSPDEQALRTIGYQEPIRYLRGYISESEMVRLIKRNSRRYAKRQLTWFRREKDYIWLDASAPIHVLADKILDPAH